MRYYVTIEHAKTAYDVPLRVLICDCGWQKKIYSVKEAEKFAEEHIWTKHRVGTIMSPHFTRNID